MADVNTKGTGANEEKDDDVNNPSSEGAQNTEAQNADNGSQNNEGNDGQNNEGNKGGNGKTFTQAQVSSMMAREKNQGRNAALRDLGIDPKDTKTIEMIKAITSSQKGSGDEGGADNNTAIAEAERRAETAEAKAEAMQSGVKSQFVDDAVTLIMAKKTEDTDLATLFSELKTKYPVWFENPGDDDSKKEGQKGTGSSVNSKHNEGGASNAAKGLGARLAAQRKTSNKSSTSYWGKNSK